MNNKKLKIYIFGNALLDFDNQPLFLKPELEIAFPEIEFIIQDPSENLHPENKELVIIDTVINTDKVRVIHDISLIDDSPNFSVHDFDLGVNLKLLQKIGELDKVTIFGVPPNIKKQVALAQLVFEISNFLKETDLTPTLS